MIADRSSFARDTQLTTLVPFFFVSDWITACSVVLRFGSLLLYNDWLSALSGPPFLPVDGLSGWPRAEVLYANLLGVYLLPLPFLGTFSVWPSHQGMDWGLLLDRSWGGILIKLRRLSAVAHQGFLAH